VDLVIEEGANLAAFQTDIIYDPTVVHVTSFQLGPFLSSSGRTIVPVGPTIDNGVGKVTFGAYSFGSQSGASGAGTLAVVTFQPRAVGTTELRLQNFGLADPNSNAISATITHGRVQVTQCFGDFDGDNDVDIFDLQRAASHWNCRSGSTCYDPQFDTEPDGDIDVFDLQRIAAAWGTTCPATVGQMELGQGEDTAIRPGATFATSLNLLPSSRRVAPSEVFTQTMRLQDAANLGAFQTAVKYDPVVVQVESVTIGPFLGSNGLTVIPVGPVIDNSAGRATFGAFTYGGQPGASGAGDLAYIRFKAQANGDTAVIFEEAGLSDPQGNPLSIGSQTGAQVSVGAQARIYLPLVLR
jgi:hypothetical protein